MAAVELKVETVALDWKGNPVVVLREIAGKRAVFIWVGVAEATAISWQLEGQRPPRPMTHDLIVLLLDQFDVQVDSIAITDVQNGTYYANLNLLVADKLTSIDCRPSDAIAVGLRTGAALYIDNDLLDKLDLASKDQNVELGAGVTVVDTDETTVH